MLLGPVVGAPLPEWQQMVELNVLGLLYCAHAALPHLLRAAGDGPRQVADMVNISSVAGRAARNGNGVYSLTKHGIGAFSESLRQEVARQYVRVSLVEPGATATELASHNRPEVLESIRSQFGQRMEAGDIADAVTGTPTTRPRHVAVNEDADSPHRTGAVTRHRQTVLDMSSTPSMRSGPDRKSTPRAAEGVSAETACEIYAQSASAERRKYAGSELDDSGPTPCPRHDRMFPRRSRLQGRQFEMHYSAPFDNFRLAQVAAPGRRAVRYPGHSPLISGYTGHRYRAGGAVRLPMNVAAYPV